jgi:hypothetical protein
MWKRGRASSECAAAQLSGSGQAGRERSRTGKRGGANERIRRG